MDIADFRKEYTRGGLSRREVPDDPSLLFGRWLEEAIVAELPEPNAMLLASASVECRPSARTVLLKGFEDGKFLFFTNYESRKGRQIAGNPHVSLSFVWLPLERQVHVEGTAAPLPAVESDAYFDSRPYGSRIGALVSPQSRVIPSRHELVRRFDEAFDAYRHRPLLRPSCWGGYAVTPQRYEFWQGRENRLHDRILYVLQSDGDWRIERLAP